MPHLVQMDKRYRDKGLVVIGDEVQGSPDDAIEKIAKDARIEFTITKGSTKPPTLQGIPHAVVFDPTGKLVFAGHPGQPDFDRVIKDSLKAVEAGETEESDESDSRLPPAPKPVIESRTWTNAEGRQITAAVLSIAAETLRFKLANGREVNYPIAKLSVEDQTIVRQAVADEDAKENEDEDADENE